MPAAFSTEVVQTGSEVVIHVRGDVDIATAQHLRAVIEPHMAPQQTIVLDLSEITFMDSACLHVLRDARTMLTRDGGSLIIRNPSRSAHLLLTAAGASELLDADDAAEEDAG